MSEETTTSRDSNVGSNRSTLRLAFHRWFNNNRSKVVAGVSLSLGLIAWEIVGTYFVDDIILVGPSAVIDEFIEMVKSGEYMTHFWTSFQEFALGYLGALIVGIGAGLSMALFEPIEELLNPWIDILYSTPRLALAPLFIVWLGIGIWSKVVVIFLGAVFPILVNTLSGFQNVDDGLIRTAKSFGASDYAIFRSVLLPGALPSIIAGLRLGSARAVVGIVVAEFFGSRAGFGFLIFQASQSFRIAEMFVGIVSLAGGGLLLVYSIKFIEDTLTPWKTEGE